MLSDRRPHTTTNKRYTRMGTKKSEEAKSKFTADNLHYKRGFDEALAGECALIPGDLFDRKEPSELWLAGWEAGQKELESRSIAERAKDEAPY